MEPLYIDADTFPSSQRLPWRLDRVLIAAACLVLAFGVLAMGAVEPRTQFILRSCAAGVFLLWAGAQVVQGKLRVVSSPVYAPALAFVGVVILQMLFGVTAYRHATLAELLNYIGYGLLAFVLLQALRGSQSTEFLGFCFSAFGLIVATFALLNYFTSNGKLFWIVQLPADALFFGPYVNHNHYAGLMEMLIAFPLVFALQTQVSLAARIFFGLSAIIMGVSVVESGSRGGTIAMVCQILLLVAIGRFTKMKRGAAVALLLVLVAMAVLLAVVADSAVVARISTLREPGRADVSGWRMRLNRDSLAMVRARPLLGWGLGTFSTVYPQFRSFYDDAPIREAHDDYMQLLVETGVVGAIITVWFLFVVFREGWRNIGRSESIWDRGITVAAIVSVSGILIHSASDFNLHIPGNAAIFFAMCALVVAPVISRGSLPQSRYRRGKAAAGTADGSEALAEVEEFPQRLRVVVRRL